MLSLGDLIYSQGFSSIYILMDPKFIISSRISLSTSRVLSLAIRRFQLDIWEARKLNSLSNLSLFPLSGSFLRYQRFSILTSSKTSPSPPTSNQSTRSLLLNISHTYPPLCHHSPPAWFRPHHLSSGKSHFLTFSCIPYPSMHSFRAKSDLSKMHIWCINPHVLKPLIILHFSYYKDHIFNISRPFMTWSFLPLQPHKTPYLS